MMEGKRSRKPGRHFCAGCRKTKGTARCGITVEWPGGGVRIIELYLCGACTFALLHIVDSGAMKVGVQTSLPFDT